MSPDYRKMFELAGLRQTGQLVKVRGGKYNGLINIVKAINFSEGEILLDRKPGPYPMIEGERWFPLAMIEVLHPERGAALPSPEPVATAPLAEIKFPHVVEEPRINPEPEIVPSQSVLSWIPKRKS